MKPIPMIRVNMLLPFVSFLDRLGSPVETWLEEVNLSPFLLNDPECLVPRHLIFSFLDKAASKEGIENMGLLVGQESSFKDLGNFGRLIYNSVTLYEALNTIQRIFALNASGVVYWVEEEEAGGVSGEEKSWLCMQHIGSRSIHSPYAAQFTLMQMLSLFNLVAGKDWRPLEMCLQTHQTKRVRESDIFQGITLETGVGFTGVAFPRCFLALPLKKTPDNGSGAEKAWNSLRSSAAPENLVESLEKSLVPLLRGGYPDIEIAAEIAGMSVRTLQRRLGEQRMTYSKLVEKARFQQALIWLQDPSIQIVDIAMELGYSAHPHFSRAFKRWTGVSPAQYRRLAAENPDFALNFNGAEFLQ